MGAESQNQFSGHLEGGVHVRRSWSRALATLRSAVAALASLLLLASIAQAAQIATPLATSVSNEPAGSLPPAWLEFGPGGQLLARAIAAENCPPLTLDGRDVPMPVRSPASDAFPVVSCEATIPFGVQAAAIGEQILPLPAGPLTRIAVIGDTGCRLSDWDKKYQACNDPEAWPFAEVAATVAAWQPDLIVHVGDYLYREAPCPDGNAGCAGSPHGDNWATWNADFFAPASPLLGSAPWVFMRGNHETCERNPEGWFAFLDPRPFMQACQRFTDPYVTTLNGITFAVIDSAEASDTTTSPREAQEYARQFDVLGGITPAGSWLVTHRPVWGILEGKDGDIEVENSTYEAATAGSLKADYALVLSGHIHLAQAIAFEPASARPPQIVSGNSGTALDDVPTGTPTASELDDPDVEEAETLSAFGFLTFERDGERWLATQRNAGGTPLVGCVLDPTHLGCAAP
jgi:hypothetical protein